METAAQKNIAKDNSTGMNKWVVVFCWIVIFAGAYQLWRLFEFRSANPAPATLDESSLVQMLRYVGSFGVLALGVIIRRWKGLAVSAVLVGMGHMALFIFRV